MDFSTQSNSIYDEESWGGIDSVLRVSSYKIQENKSSYGTMSSGDFYDYYEITPGIGTFVLYVTTDPANQIPQQPNGWGLLAPYFDIKITDFFGNIILSADSIGQDIYTDKVSFTSTSNATYFIEIRNSVASSFSYAATLRELLEVNSAPISSDGNAAVEEDAVLLGVLPDSVDVDGDPITYFNVFGPSHGSVIIDPIGVYIYKPDEDFNGTDAFLFAVADDKGGFNIYTQTISIVPVNDPPIIVESINNQSVAANAAFDFSIPANTFADVDGGSLAISVAQADGSELPNWLRFDAATLKFSGTPAIDDLGIVSIKVTASDGTYAISDAFDIAVVLTPNSAPSSTDGSATTPEDSKLDGNLPEALDADGDLISYAKYSEPSHGSVTVYGNGAYSYTPNPNFSGGDSFRFQVADDKGGLNIYIQNLTIAAVNDSPALASVIPDQRVFVDKSFVFGVSAATFSDVDGDPLTYSAVQTDGSPLPSWLNFDTDTRTFAGTPTLADSGELIVRVTASDGELSVSGSFTLTVDAKSNSAPTSSNGSASVAEDAQLNDFLPVAFDADGDPITYTIVTEPNHGSVVVYPDGSYYYIADVDYYGVDSFSFEVSDGNDKSSPYIQEIAIERVNDAPLAANSSENGVEDGTINGVFNASDAENDSLSYSIVNQPSNGVLVINLSGGYTYTPKENFNGSDSFTFKASDGFRDSNEATVVLSISGVNDAPVSSNTGFAWTKTTTFSGQLPPAFDVDGDQVFYAKVGNPGNGTVLISPDGSFKFTPNIGFVGVDSFLFSVSDGMARSVYTVNLAVTASNSKPKASNGTASTAEDTILFGRLPRATDEEGDSVSYSLVSDPLRGSVTIRPDGSFEYNPEPNYHGADVFYFAVTDSRGGSNSYSMAIAIGSVNDAPIAISKTFSGIEDRALAGRLLAEDVDGDDLSFQIVTQPSHGTLDLTNDGNFIYSPDENFFGVDDFNFMVTDSAVAVSSGSVSIRLDPSNDPPVSNDERFIVDSRSLFRGKLPVSSDIDGNTISYALVGSPQQGSVQIDPSGDFVYSPPADFVAPDTFYFSVSDEQNSFSNYLVHLYPESWLIIARIANAWFNGTLGHETMTILASGVERFFTDDPILFGAEVYRQYGFNIEPSDLAQSVANNLGLMGEANGVMARHLRDVLEAIGGDAPGLADFYDRGRALVAEIIRFTTLVDDSLFGEAARRFNAEVEAALRYASLSGTKNIPTNEDGSPVDLPGDQNSDSRLFGLSVGETVRDGEIFDEKQISDPSRFNDSNSLEIGLTGVAHLDSLGQLL